MSEFATKIEKFNRMYGMPVAAAPVPAGAPVQGQSQLDRLENFGKILGKELDELKEVIELFKAGGDHLAAMTALADLLGDLQVYCASEEAKWGLPHDTVLSIIMDSNFSKMGADGNPIYDDQGKLQKGPDYWKPEPKIYAALSGRVQAAALLAQPK